MSGPKKADVEAQLNVAKNSQRNCAKLISRAEDAAIARMIREADAIIGSVNSVFRDINNGINDISGDMRRVAPDSVRDAVDAAQQAGRGLDDAGIVLTRARDAVANAGRIEESARQTFERAEREYDRAVTALRNAGGHYMHNEMEWARQATSLYEQAARELASASAARKEAQTTAQSALQKANEARSRMLSVLNQVHSTRNEAESRLRAEEEAGRIAEQKRRDATLAVERARSSTGRLSELPHNKFRPGEGNRLMRDMDATSRLLIDERFDEARNSAEGIQAETTRLEQEVLAALQEFERKRAEAESHVSALEAGLSGIDEPLIREWADTPDALQRTRKALELSRNKLNSEDFEETERIAQEAKDALSAALRSAAENKAANERREKIGEAVMDVLQGLGFEVSFQQGTRTDLLKISGQTPDELGKGDFDIAIPLDGNVDFEVNTPEGDTTCIAAVQSMQKRLEERGIKWNTTNWGHADGARPTVGQKNIQKVKEKAKTKIK